MGKGAYDRLLPAFATSRSLLANRALVPRAGFMLNSSIGTITVLFAEEILNDLHQDP